MAIDRTRRPAPRPNRAAAPAAPEPALTTEEIAGFRGQLQALRTTLNGTVQALAEDTLKPARAEDEDTDSFDQGLAISVAGNQSDLLRDIDDALRRIESGAYGICEMTGKPIARVRLHAIPYARYCIEAQSGQEHDRSRMRRAEAAAPPLE